MKQSLEIRHGQRLQLTPRLQQSIRLLHLSLVDLAQEITAAMESNPFLEEAETDVNELPIDASAALEAGADDGSLEAQIHADRDTCAPDYFADDEAGNNYWRDSGGRGAGGRANTEQASDWAEEPAGLAEILLGELSLHRLSVTDRVIAQAIIGNLDDRGYLAANFDELRVILSPDIAATDDEIEAVLHLVQSLSHPGIASRNPRECLLLQLSVLGEDTPGLTNAQRLADQYLTLLSERRYDELLRHLHIDRKQLSEAVSLIHSLDPAPGEHLSSSVAQYIVPDACVYRQGRRWGVRLTQESARNVRLNDYYRQYLGENDPATRKYLKERLQEARWFIRSLKQRDNTILRVAREIVDHQQAFMAAGDSALTALTMREVAARLELHESTISRAVDQKYLLTPHGIFELKHFFSGQIGEATGTTTSARAVQARIQKVIQSEPRAKPVSDSRITAILNDEGILIARRTVAKYREQMNIPPANRRRSVL
ncbi:MAG: RNA polymerase factor sigma-54 [Arenicellales bacterium]|nr:RNA polymerase factor sigma-54 [Arenicellales bacterium]MDP7491171.1 RNA polymerase factor sigma-54 [Arenicellales bacterium]